MILKELINKFDKSSIKAGEGLEKGQFPLYTCSPLVNKFLDDYICDGEAIVISTGGNFAVHYVNGKFNYSTDCYVFNTDKLDTKYLYYYLISKTDDINKLFRGAGLKHLNKNEFLLMNVDNIDIQNQKRIVEHLDKISNLIELRKKQVNKCDNLIKSQFVEMFGEPLINNKKWKNGTINDLIIDAKYGTSRPSINGGKYKYLRMNNITYDGKLDIKDLKYIDIPDNELDKYTTKRGDILFNRTNSRDLVGKTCVYNLDEKMVIAGFIIRVRTNQLANPYFISAYLNTSILKEKLYSMCKNASGQSNINAQELKNIEIYIPPIELQNKFAKIVEQIDKQKFVSEKMLEIIGKLSNLW